MKLLMHYNYSPMLAFRLLLVFALSVPSPFWVEVKMLLDVPDEVKNLIAPLVGSACVTIVEVVRLIKASQALGKPVTIPHYWPLTVFVGWMVGLICTALFAKAVGVIMPLAPSWTVGFIGGAVGYWLLDKALPVFLDKKLKKIENGENPLDL